MKIKSIANSFLVSILFFTSLSADDFSDNFRSHLNTKALDALAQDMGSLMGAGSFHTGKTLGFPVGFDVGVHVPIVGVQTDNAILKDNSSTAQALWGNLEIGLPASFNLVARMGSLEDADLISGGIRYGILDPSLPGLPALSISGFYNTADHELFDAEGYTLNLVASIDFPFIHPYLGGSYDSTKIDPKSTAFTGAGAGASTSIEGKSDGYRVEGGVNISILPFTYINLGMGTANGQELYNIGAGLSF